MLVLHAGLFYREAVDLVNTTMGNGGSFPETRPSLVEELGQGMLSPATWEYLCQRYWGPIYCYLRRGRRVNNQEAKDLTQSFMVWLRDNASTLGYEKERASFRSFLKGVLSNYVRNQLRRDVRRRRHEGNWREFLPDEQAVDRLAELADRREDSPAEAFDRAWVQALVRRSLARTQLVFQERGHNMRFEVYAAYELLPGTQKTYAGLAEERGLQVSDIRNYLYEARRVLRKEIKKELLETVNDPSQLDAEWDVIVNWGN